MTAQELYQDPGASLDAYRDVPSIAPTHPLGQEDHMRPQHVPGLVEGHRSRALRALPHVLIDRTRRALSRAPVHQTQPGDARPRALCQSHQGAPRIPPDDTHLGADPTE